MSPSQTLVICDHAKSRIRTSRHSHVINVNQKNPGQNIRLEGYYLSHRLLRSLSAVTRDLLDIAAYVYAADTTAPRSHPSDVFDEGWNRNFAFVVPVREPDLWRQEAVKSKLSELLEFLTDDRYEFVFTKRKGVTEQLVFEELAEGLAPYTQADCVSLFSGGMDSLAGAIDLYQNGRRPVLVSHQSRPFLVSLQRKLAQPLRQRFDGWSFPHLGMWINRIGSRASENTQRSRSFLYLALGALVAFELGIEKLVVCENGITTFNLPRIGQVLGAQATRSTHPQVLSNFEQLLRLVLGKTVSIETPFLWNTRAEIATIFKRTSTTDLLRASNSCARSHPTLVHPHCGTCSQCVDRRLAVGYADLDSAEELDQYEKDIFTEDLGEGVERTQVVSPVQFALDVRGRTLDEFCQKYTQVYDAVGYLPSSSDEVLRSIYQLHGRYANEVIAVMQKENGRQWDRRYNREVSDNCLLTLTRTDAQITKKAEALKEQVRACPPKVIKLYQDVCRDVLEFLFSDYVPKAHALEKPEAQAPTDQEYKVRDLVFENNASAGFWAEAKRDYSAHGVIADAKNYRGEISGRVVREFATTYLSENGLGRFGILIPRKLPSEAKTIVTSSNRVPSAVEEQKEQWAQRHNMVILLDDDDLVGMVNQKAAGKDPTELIKDRAFLLRKRV